MRLAQARFVRDMRVMYSTFPTSKEFAGPRRAYLDPTRTALSDVGAGITLSTPRRNFDSSRNGAIRSIAE
jgi:hypothetical protein